MNDQQNTNDDQQNTINELLNQIYRLQTENQIQNDQIGELRQNIELHLGTIQTLRNFFRKNLYY